jgi:hypothetical protein
MRLMQGVHGGVRQQSDGQETVLTQEHAQELDHTRGGEHQASLADGVAT